MDLDYLWVCGLIWRNTSDAVAGAELINGLASRDPHIRQLAKEILMASGQAAMNLLESAFADGRITPESAGECLAQLFRTQHKEELTDWEQACN